MIQSAQKIREQISYIFQSFQKMEPGFQIFHIPDPIKCVLGPGDVLACPMIYRFVLKPVDVPQTISDPPQKLIVYTLRSIWQ